MSDEHRDFSGNVHLNAQEAHKANMNSGGSGGGFIGQMMGSFGPLLLIVLFIPIVIAGIFQLVFNLLFKLKIVGRIIQSAIYGFILGFPLLFGIGALIPALDNAGFIIRALAVAVIFGLPSIWYYYSHYYTLKALLSDKRFSNETADKFMLFIFTISIMWFGVVVLGIISWCLSSFKNIEMPAILFVIPFILAAIYYGKAVMSDTAQEGAKIIKSEIKSPIIGVPFAVVLAFIIPFNLMSNSAVKSAKYEKEEAKVAAIAADVFTNFSGKTIVIFTSTLKLHAEASGASRVVKTLNKDDKIKTTGNVSGLWIPVEAGSDKGFVFAPSMRIEGASQYDKNVLVDFPYEATSAAPIQLYLHMGVDELKSTQAHVLPTGSAVTITSSAGYSNGKRSYLRIKFENVSYDVHNEAAENFVLK
jgi:hypothetical protein